jgi:DNA-directed RNA polymerases I, II, and III subunit RPABC3
MLSFLANLAHSSILSHSPHAPSIHFSKNSPVSRIECKPSEVYQMDLALDVATDVYPLAPGDKVAVALARTLNLDGTPTDPTWGVAAQAVRATLADSYEYVMYGKVFKFKDAPGGGGGAGGGAGGGGGSGGGRLEAYASFGGLLLKLVGGAAQLKGLTLDAGVFLLMRKAEA